jgi:hypothetical protein
MKNLVIRMADVSGSFAENKDKAKDLRDSELLPGIKKGRHIVLDWSGVDATTQSFVHALISKIFQDKGEVAFQLIEFKHCSGPVKGLISTVINYSVAAESSPS